MHNTTWATDERKTFLVNLSIKYPTQSEKNSRDN
jgi:hypothetical protein